MAGDQVRLAYTYGRKDDRDAQERAVLLVSLPRLGAAGAVRLRRMHCRKTLPKPMRPHQWCTCRQLWLCCESVKAGTDVEEERYVRFPQDFQGFMLLPPFTLVFAMVMHLGARVVQTAKLCQRMEGR